MMWWLKLAYDTARFLDVLVAIVAQVFGIKVAWA